MKRLFYIILITFLITPFYPGLADKPYHEWDREDVMEYFESNNILFEGEYKNSDSNQFILIGRLNSKTEKVSMNFILKEGKLQKALLTTYENTTFNSLQTVVQDKGFKMLSLTNDKLGNQYRKYILGSIELTVVNKKADWPEIYFQP